MRTSLSTLGEWALGERALQVRRWPRRFSPALWLCPVVLAAAGCGRPAEPAGGPARLPSPAVHSDAAPLPGEASAAAAAPGEASAPSNSPLRAIGPVATVNGKDITADRFNAELDKLVGQGAQIPSDRLRQIARNIANKLIEAELRSQAVAAEGLQVSEAEVEQVWREFVQRFAGEDGRVDETRLREELRRTRSTMDQVREQLRQQRLAKKLVERLGKVEVTETEARQFYDNNPSAWTEQASRDVRAVVVRTAADAKPSERDKAKEQAQAAYEALKKGGDFEVVAKQFGDGAQQPMHLLRNASDAALEKIAFEMKVGDIAPPIQTRWGWYVIRLIEKNDQRIRPFNEVQDEIRKSLLARKSFVEDRRILQELRKKADVIEKLPF